MAEYHFVEDYEKHVTHLIAHHPLDEAMSRAVGGETVADYKTIGQIEAQLLRSLGLARGMHLVDLGCGSGRLAAELHGVLDITYVGIDIIQSLLDYAKTKAPTYQFIRHRDLSIPLSAGSADMICAFSLFTHLLHTETYIYLEEAVRVLKPGGRMVFSFLEFEELAHWDIFVRTKNARKTCNPPLDMFIERNAINTWATHLDLIVEQFIAGAGPIGDFPGLGQSAVVLRKP
jgi:ubiquinone/menaquinone biosynthesis C-methylase UbiE